MRTVATSAISTGVLAGLLCLGGPALAQDVQVLKQEFAKKEKVKSVEWKASAAAGATIAAGNSTLVNISGGAKASRNDGTNKVALELTGNYATSTVQTLRPRTDPANPMNPPMVPAAAGSASDLDSTNTTTAGYFMGKLRYDRFFTEHNSGYLAGFGGLDLLAGKKATGGAELGYARQIAKTRTHDLSGEIGMDYIYTSYVQPDQIPSMAMTMVPFSNSVHLASARLFLGYLMTLSENTSIDASFEALINFNPAAIGDRLNYDDPHTFDPMTMQARINPFTGAPGGDARAGFGQATRWIAKTGLTSKIWKMISFRAAESLRFDNAPALSKIPWVAPAAGQVLSTDRYLQKLDSLTEINVVINFL